MSQGPPSNAPIPPANPKFLPLCFNLAHHLWLTFFVHEQFAIQNLLSEFVVYGISILETLAMPKSEKQEYHSCRHAFLHVPQKLYSFSRPDGIPGQYLHLTQVPHGCDVDPKICLSMTYQSILCFDYGHFGMKKQKVQEATAACFELMGIHIALHFREPILAINHKLDIQNWIGFIKVDLLNFQVDGLVLQ